MLCKQHGTHQHEFDRQMPHLHAFAHDLRHGCSIRVGANDDPERLSGQLVEQTFVAVGRFGARLGNIWPRGPGSDAER